MRARESGPQATVRQSGALVLLAVRVSSGVVATNTLSESGRVNAKAKLLIFIVKTFTTRRAHTVNEEEFGAISSPACQIRLTLHLRSACSTLDPGWKQKTCAFGYARQNLMSTRLTI